MADQYDETPKPVIEDEEFEEEFQDGEEEADEIEEETEQEETDEEPEEDIEETSAEPAEEGIEGEGDGEDEVYEEEDYDGGSAKKKMSGGRRNKNSKRIDYKTFQTIAKGGISSAIKLGDEETEMNLKKFEGEIEKDYLIHYHPEIKTHNYDEIATLSTIVRNKEGQIVDNFHKTVPFITKFEKARILGLRAKQINNGASVMIDVPENVIDGYTIAQMEYEQKKIPFIIKRPLPNGAIEYWKFADLEQINL